MSEYEYVGIPSGTDRMETWDTIPRTWNGEPLERHVSYDMALRDTYLQCGIVVLVSADGVNQGITHG